MFISTKIDIPDFLYNNIGNSFFDLRDKMSTRRRVLLLVLIVVMTITGSVYLNNQANRQTIETKGLDGKELDNLSKDMEDLIKELERLLAQADNSIETLQRLPQPDNGVKTSYHDGGYEDSWIQFVDEKEGLVQVETVESRIAIRFRPQKEALSKFAVGPMAAVTIKCVDGSVNCDLDPKHILYIKNGQVELVQWKFLTKTKRLKMK